MQFGGLYLKPGKANAGDTACHAGKKFLHQRARKSKRFEIAAAAIGGDHGNSHLRDDFEEPRFQRFFVIIGAAPDGHSLKPALRVRLRNRIESEIRVHDGRSNADEHCGVMGVNTLCRPHD